MQLKNIWVIIPAYNEDYVIGSVVSDIIKLFPSIIVIDDCSSDKTYAVAKKAGAHVVRHPINLGQGAALQTGFEYALSFSETQVVITFDADGQHDIKDALAMVKLLEKDKLDVVIGSRFLDKRTKISYIKKVILKIAAKWGSWSTGLHLTDAHNGLRVISKKTLEQLHLRQNRMAHASEIIDQFGELKVKYKEYPNLIRYTPYSLSKGQPLLNSVNILIDLMVK